MQTRREAEVPWGVHALTALHGLGAIACVVMALGSAISERFRLSLVASPGSALMMDLFGPRVWIFLLAIAALLAALSYGSWHLRRWAWPLTIVCYSIGVVGGLWEVTIGIRAGLLAAAINAAVVAYACTRRVRAAYQSVRPKR
ncbi:MAG: hypothetical protein AVDCRST_MAG42-1133 [uncultured Chthoniobacterales bacterium]|uniref:DUF2127 domain-containing protein n=1 Tax=uncultured Chthoniobacterales bacterium TaxID=1836801 RepID=A0A6J4HRL1_9BACT|nr:MAG: hypothetical protein AVDCRST_MAG42-1133 [uncultured Chthoniobacterales bacterium]